MIVLIKNSEMQLLEKLERVRKENPSQRCFFMEFSKTPIPRETLFKSFLSLLQEIPNSYMAEVYICQDMDVFILMQGFMQRQFSDFLKALSAELDAGDLSTIASVMEAGIHGTAIEKICREKIATLEKEGSLETEQKRKAAAEKATLEILSSLDPGLLSSVAARRKERLSPLVMVVDDDQISRMLAGNVIRESYEWIYARNGTEAIKSYVERAPDVLFLDIGLPDISGHDILECLFQIDPHAYVIMFSGRKDKENIMKALEAGAQGFVGKPFTREKLFQYIERSPHLPGKKGAGKSRAATMH